MSRSNTGSASNWLSNASSPVQAVPFTFGAWVYPTSTASVVDTIVIGDASAGSNYYVIYLNTTNGSTVTAGAVTLESAAGGSSVRANTTTTFTVNTWNHVCAVCLSATSKTIYLNGGSKATIVTSSVPSGALRVTIGGYNVAGTLFSPLTGRIADVAIWNTALSDAEVAALAGGTPSSLIRRSNLKAFWPLRDQSLLPVPPISPLWNLSVTGTMGLAPNPPMLDPLSIPSNLLHAAFVATVATDPIGIASNTMAMSLP